MMMQEFVARTGFTPTAEEYAQIEQQYYDFDGDKDAFCKAFNVKAFTEGRRQKIESLKSDMAEAQKAA